MLDPLVVPVLLDLVDRPVQWEIQVPAVLPVRLGHLERLVLLEEVDRLDNRALLEQ